MLEEFGSDLTLYRNLPVHLTTVFSVVGWLS